MINFYNNAENYQKNTISIEMDEVPKFLAFITFDGEKHIFEERERNVPYYNVISALESGYITELDKKIVCLVAVFSSSCCTKKFILEMLTMLGKDESYATLTKSVEKLHKLQLINFSRFTTKDMSLTNFRVISLTQYGQNLAKTLGVFNRFNPIALATSEPHKVKSYLATAQFICNYLKHIKLQSFEIRPVVVVNPEESAIIRPSASITVDEDTILYVESPRRYENWIEDIIEKIDRYKLVFEDKEVTIILNCEDEQMSLELSKYLSKINLKNLEILFTDDRKTYADLLKSSIYNFNKEEKIVFEFNSTLYFR